MEISSQIDRLISKLNELRPLLTENALSNSVAFNSILSDSIRASSKNEGLNRLGSDLSSGAWTNSEMNQVSRSGTDYKTPNWVNDAYHYDPLKPRKPNMREVMEAMSGQSLEELQAGPASEYSNYSKKAATLLYSVVGEKEDTRNWSKILSSGNVVEQARAETTKLHKPIVEIKNVLDAKDQVIKQYAIIKSSDGLALHTLSGTAKILEETLKNYGANSASIPVDIESKIIPGKFDPTLLDVLKKFDKEVDRAAQEISSPEKFDSTTVSLTTDYMKNVITAEEFEKL